MYKVPVKYTDFEGVERSENFYFNLTKAELYEMEITTPGKLTSRLEKLSANAGATPSEEAQSEIYKVFKEFILKAYGEKITDERGVTRFKKSKELSEAFATTEAFSEMFMGFMQNPDTAVDFLKAIIPEQVAEAATAQLNTAHLA